VPAGVAFHYDLGDPECWLVAERIAATLPVVPEFVPVLAREVTGSEAPAPDREALGRRAADLALLPMRWPARWPVDSELAALAATFAAGIGKVVAFSLAAFRQTFAAGRDLSEQETVLIAAAACEIHPRAVLGAVRRATVARALERAGERARRAGVQRLPAITAGELVFEGEGCPEAAAKMLARDRRVAR
jgi:2-hydroxychromene-2-carboxylate isomerase